MTFFFSNLKRLCCFETQYIYTSIELAANWLLLPWTRTQVAKHMAETVKQSFEGHFKTLNMLCETGMFESKYPVFI